MKALADGVFNNINSNIAKTNTDTVIEKALESEHKALSRRTKNRCVTKVKALSYLINKTYPIQE